MFSDSQGTLKVPASNPKIEEVLSTFDFIRVRETMFHLKWQWCFGKAMRIPDSFELSEAARRLLYSLAGDNELRCGGFRAQRWEDGNYSLSFEVDWKNSFR